MPKNILAKKYFYEKEYKKAKELFIEAGMFYEAGLCCFLLRDFDSAKKYWSKTNENIFATNWGLCVLDIINNIEPFKNPTYFQIRAFYEIYISLLIENEMFDIAERLVQNYQYFSFYNLEVPKFISRVLHAYNYDEPALYFIEKSLEENYIDIEALFIGVQIYLNRGDYNKANDYLKLLFKNTPHYYPALKIKEKLPKNFLN